MNLITSAVRIRAMGRSGLSRLHRTLHIGFAHFYPRSARAQSSTFSSAG